MGLTDTVVHKRVQVFQDLTRQWGVCGLTTRLSMIKAVAGVGKRGRGTLRINGQVAKEVVVVRGGEYYTRYSRHS